MRARSARPRCARAVRAIALAAMLLPTAAASAVRRAHCEAPADWSRVDATGLPLVRFSALP